MTQPINTFAWRSPHILPPLNYPIVALLRAKANIRQKEIYEMVVYTGVLNNKNIWYICGAGVEVNGEKEDVIAWSYLPPVDKLISVENVDDIDYGI